MSHWSKAEYGDIHANVKTYEGKVKIGEENLILNINDDNKQEFHRLQDEYIGYLKVEDIVL